MVEFTRKHTSSVHSALSELRRLIEGLVAKRDERRDRFVPVIAQAMRTSLGDNVDEVLKTLAKQGISRQAGKLALDLAQERGRFTVFSLVDALTRLAGELTNAGDRTEADERAGALLALAL